MNYIVYFDVSARFDAAVEANNIEDAIESARQRFSDADFGEAYNIDGEEIMVEDENGKVYPVAS